MYVRHRGSSYDAAGQQLKVVDDRAVFDNGITKRCRCPVGGSWTRVASKVLSGLRNSSGHQHGQASPA